MLTAASACGRTFSSALLQAVTGLMTLVLVVIFAVYAMRASQAQQQARRVPIIVEISD